MQLQSNTVQNSNSPWLNNTSLNNNILEDQFSTFSEYEEFVRVKYREWISELNQLAVRREDLKKFVMEKEIGCGGQARVYKVY